MPIHLRWNGNIDAQRRADAAYARLKPKPAKSRRKRLRRANRKPNKIRLEVKSTPAPTPLFDLDAEFAAMVRSF